MLGNQDAVGAPCQASHRRDPTRVPAHHLHHHDTLVRFCRGVQPVDGFGDNGNSGIESKRSVCSFNVVVNRLRDTNHFHTLGHELTRHAQSVLTAYRDQRIDLELIQVFQQGLLVAVGLEWVGP